MSLNPRVGHLYHDHNISNECTALDAKETLRTREINAREAKHLEKYSYLIDRAKTTCMKHNDWEQRAMRRSLEDIRYKTPSLSKSLLCETDRIKSNNNVIQGIRNGSENLETVKKSKLKTKVSPWSVYSQLTDTNTCSDSRRPLNSRRRKQRGSEFSYNNCGQISSSGSRAGILVRKADTVTKSLHRLYSRSLERRWRESNTTVLDILGKESKEELEKALFLLRGTTTGDTIEDILKERERVSKTASEKSKSNKTDVTGIGSLDEISKHQLGTEEVESVGKASDESKEASKQSRMSESPASTEKILINLDDVLPKKTITSAWEKEVSEQGLKFSKKGTSQNETTEDLKHVFDKEATWTMSSVLANPSDQGSEVRNMKWTELLKAPELWKLNTVKFSKSYKPRPVSLVTLAGKRRRTLLR